MRLLILFPFLFWSVATFAADIKHKEIVLYLEDDTVMIDLAEQYLLNETMLEALENGVPLVFETRIKMREDGAYIWQGNTAEIVLRNKLEYYPLSALYEVDHMDGSKEAFASLTAALESLGLMKAVPIISRSEINLQRHYMVTVQTGLDVGSLPAPLRPAAYVLPRWHLQSKEWEWRLKP